MQAELKKCACKGIRKCLICEGEDSPLIVVDDKHKGGGLTPKDIWYYCVKCRDKAYKTSDDHQNHSTSQQFATINGVFVLPEFLSKAEEENVIDAIDRIPWIDSQSGRRKHDFGPKVNFKRKKIKWENFHGFPTYSKFILDRMKTIDVLSDFLPVEMCNLEYEPRKGAAIDPHFDDFWLWGERLVTVNMLSETCYTLTQSDNNMEIVVPLPRRSLIVLYGDARYKWMHSISRCNIQSRRLGITIRELTPEFLKGGASYTMGKQLLEKAVPIL